jgi:hypothetical protein
MEEQLTALRKANTWKIVELLTGMNVVGSKWVYQVKKDVDGNIVCKMVHLVMQIFFVNPWD